MDHDGPRLHTSSDCTYQLVKRQTDNFLKHKPHPTDLCYAHAHASSGYECREELWPTLIAAKCAEMKPRICLRSFRDAGLHQRIKNLVRGERRD
jgi:hypothetical protein